MRRASISRRMSRSESSTPPAYRASGADAGPRASPTPVCTVRRVSHTGQTRRTRGPHPLVQHGSPVSARPRRAFVMLAGRRKACRGCSSMAELQLPKLIARVRFPSSPPMPSTCGRKVVREGIRVDAVRIDSLRAGPAPPEAPHAAQRRAERRSGRFPSSPRSPSGAAAGRACSGQSSVSASVRRGLSPGGASTSTARAWRARLK